MRIATLATGGIGGFLAVRLIEAGHEVACIARGAHLDAIRADGLRLESGGATQSVQPWRATADTAEIGPVDAVIFGVKAAGLEAAAEACRPLLGDDTIVVPFLNGVEAAERLAAILPAPNVGNGVAYVSTTIGAPGLIRQVGTGGRFLISGRAGHADAGAAALRDALDGAGVEAPETDDIARDMWTKFVLFTAMSGVTAAGRCTLGQVRDIPALSRLFRDVMAETEALGRARGVALPDGLADSHWQRLADAPAEMRASTAIDLEKGAALETPWVNGAVARMAEEAGTDAPANRMLAAILAPWVPGRG